MSLCLNDSRNRLRVPSSLDLSSAIDLMPRARPKGVVFAWIPQGRYTGARVARRWSRAVVKWEISA